MFFGHRQFYLRNVGYYVLGGSHEQEKEFRVVGGKPDRCRCNRGPGSGPDPAIKKPLRELTELVVKNIGSSGEDGVRFTVDSFFDVFYVTNIGSSGEDGFKANFDVFFEVDVRRTIPTEMVSMSLTGKYFGEFNPATLIDRVRSPDGSTGPEVFYGHVTFLK